MKNKIIQLKIPNNRNIKWAWLIEINKNNRYKVRYPKKNILINSLYKKNNKDFGPVKLAPKDSIILNFKKQKGGAASRGLHELDDNITNKKRRKIEYGHNRQNYESRSPLGFYTGPFWGGKPLEIINEVITIPKDAEFEPYEKYFERCIKILEGLDETATGVTDIVRFNTIDGINTDEKKPVEIKYMSNFGKENTLKIHISNRQLRALKPGGMILVGKMWDVRYPGQSGEPSNEGELIIGGFEDWDPEKRKWDKISYVKIPHSELGKIFQGILVS